MQDRSIRRSLLNDFVAQRPELPPPASRVLPNYFWGHKNVSNCAWTAAPGRGHPKDMKMDILLNCSLEFYEMTEVRRAGRGLMSIITRKTRELNTGRNYDLCGVRIGAVISVFTAGNVLLPIIQHHVVYR